MAPVTPNDILIAALTVWGEARGSTQDDRLAIAHTIINRAKARTWWGRSRAGHPAHSLAAVCLYPQQFSCWNADDPNSTKLVQLKAQYVQAIATEDGRAALKAVIDALDFVPDTTEGATHYLTTSLYNSPRRPKWCKHLAPVVAIGAHSYFEGVL